MIDLVGVIHQTRLVSRVCLFEVENLNLVASHDVEIHPESPGIDPTKIVDSFFECLEQVAQKIRDLGYSIDSIKTIGLANERNIVFAWDKNTSQALCQGLDCSDSRTESAYQSLLSSWTHDPLAYSDKTGFLLRPYTTIMGIKWLAENEAQVKQALQQGSCVFGTLDSWLLWNLLEKDRHLTDVTNASSTMLMNLKTFDWNEALCKNLNISKETLPSIRDSNSLFGHIGRGSFKGVAVKASIGDLNSTLIANSCSSKGSIQVNYDSSCHVISSTGASPVYSSSPFLQTTVGYKLENNDPVYVLEGNIEFAGASLDWLKDSLELITDHKETVHEVEDSGDVVFIPPAPRAFCSPYWAPNSRGLIIGLSQYTLRTHVVRAVLDAVAFQVQEIITDMMNKSDSHADRLTASGPLSNNESMLQILSDVLGGPIENFKLHHLVGVAIIATGRELKDSGNKNVYTPRVSADVREARHKKWRKAVEKSHNWV